MKIKDIFTYLGKEAGELNITENLIYTCLYALFGIGQILVLVGMMLFGMILYGSFSLAIFHYLVQNVLNDGTISDTKLILWIIQSIFYFPLLFFVYMALNNFNNIIWEYRQSREKEGEPKTITSKGTFTVQFHEGKTKKLSADYYIIRDKKILFRERKGPFKWPSTILSIPFDEIKSIEGMRNFEELKQEAKE